MARTKKAVKKEGVEKISTPIVSKKETKTEKGKAKENLKPENDAADDDFVESKKVTKGLKKKETKVTKVTKGLKEAKVTKGLKKKSKSVDDESDPETNDLEAIIDNSHDHGKEILSLSKSSDAVAKSEVLIDELVTSTSSDVKLQKLNSILANCLGCRFIETLNSQNLFTNIFQKFEEIIETDLLTTKVAKAVGLSLHDLLEDCGHFNKGKTFESLKIEEDFEGICKRLMKVDN